MANVMRMRTGETNPVVASAKASTAISVGDILVLSGTANAKVAEPSASGVAWDTNLATTQLAVHAAFLE